MTRTDEQQATIVAITHKIVSLGLTASFVDPVSVGPIVSVYRFQPTGSTRVNQIEALAEDFAICLGVEDVFAKRMPGEVSVGLFVPNKERHWVQWRDHCTFPAGNTVRHWDGNVNVYWNPKIPMLLGVDYLGRVVVEDLSTMPHLLIAGSTGGGKSTLLNSILGGIILNYSPKDIQFVLSDTKGVEFNHFEGAPHLYAKTATNLPTTVERLDLLIDEMSDRLARFSKSGHRSILEYNDAREATPSLKIPYLLLVIDELADLLSDRRRVEDPEANEDSNRTVTLGSLTSRKLAKLAQKARATGIHIIASTQRPSVKLLEGDIKSNFPARLTFRLPSEADSRTVLGFGGAEHLLSRGDMLFINPNKPGVSRVHAPLSSIEDIRAAIEYATARR